jgi:IPT/TIG domain-containing protein
MRLNVAVPRILLIVCAILVFVPRTANAATTTPKVTSVAPLKLKIGQRLTIRGKGFLKGKNRNTVIFKASGARAVFVKAESATTTKLVVKVPAKLASFLRVKAGQPTATRFQLRVLARKLSPTYTSAKGSPVIAPDAAMVSAGKSAAAAAAVPGATVGLSAYEACQLAALNNPAGDQDRDGMVNSTERTFGVNPCVSDTDGDGMIDGYEYEAARDLNSHQGGSGRPYPGTRPWPNPLDGSDAGNDFDGDGLTLGDEYRLWWYRGHHFPITEYSDGMQATDGRTAAYGRLDISENGWLTDDERDADGDGLSNIVELHYRNSPSWWTDVAKEKPYTLRPFATLDPTVADDDGDGVLDGADDQDVDGYSNIEEMQLTRGVPPLGPNETILYVSPFNPCMPNPHSDTCGRYIPAASEKWLPFADDDLLNNPVPLTNDGSVYGGSTDTWDGQPGNPDA